MAKKATKKKASFLTKYGKFILLALAAILFVCLALVGVTKTVSKLGGGEETLTRTLSELTFGVSDAKLGTSEVKINFSFGLLIAFILPLLVSIIGLFIKNKKVSGAIIFVGFAVSAVLFFLVPQLTSYSTIFAGEVVDTSTYAEMEYSLGYGSIIAAVISIVGALGSLCYTVAKD